MTSLLLISPLLHCGKHLRRSFQPPLNLLCLYSFLRAQNVAVAIFEPNSLEEAAEKILIDNPTLVGLPLYYASLDNSFALLKKVREKNRSIRFVAGGPCLTMDPERMLRVGGFDFGIVGEGEEPLLQLLQACEKKADYKNIAGLVFHRDGKVIVNQRAKPIADLDELPFLDFSAIDNDYYFAFQSRSAIPKTIFLNSSRGCSFRCSYCCTPVMWPGPTRRFSPPRLVKEIEFQLRQFPGAEIGFCDDSFFADRRWLEEFLQLVTPLHIKFQCIGRADHLDAAGVEKLVAAGMTYLAFGVETGSAKRQRALRKNLDLTRLLPMIQELARLKVKSKCFFMIGFPDETPAEMAETINLAVALKRAGMDFFSIFPVTLYPGTELANQFPEEDFSCGLDAHMPEIIRDGLEIDRKDHELMGRRFNAWLTQQQMVDLVSFAWQQVEKAEPVCEKDIELLIKSV